MGNSSGFYTTQFFALLLEAPQWTFVVTLRVQLLAVLRSGATAESLPSNLGRSLGYLMFSIMALIGDHIY